MYYLDLWIEDNLEMFFSDPKIYAFICEQYKPKGNIIIHKIKTRDKEYLLNKFKQSLINFCENLLLNRRNLIREKKIKDTSE
jgi:hypothetical protein